MLGGVAAMEEVVVSAKIAAEAPAVREVLAGLPADVLAQQKLDLAEFWMERGNFQEQIAAAKCGLAANGPYGLVNANLQVKHAEGLLGLGLLQDASDVASEALVMLEGHHGEITAKAQSLAVVRLIMMRSLFAKGQSEGVLTQGGLVLALDEIRPTTRIAACLLLCSVHLAAGQFNKTEHEAARGIAVCVAANAAEVATRAEGTPSGEDATAVVPAAPSAALAETVELSAQVRLYTFLAESLFRQHELVQCLLAAQEGLALCATRADEVPTMDLAALNRWRAVALEHQHLFLQAQLAATKALHLILVPDSDADFDAPDAEFSSFPDPEEFEAWDPEAVGATDGELACVLDLARCAVVSAFNEGDFESAHKASSTALEHLHLPVHRSGEHGVRGQTQTERKHHAKVKEVVASLRWFKTQAAIAKSQMVCKDHHGWSMDAVAAKPKPAFDAEADKLDGEGDEFSFDPVGSVGEGASSFVGDAGSFVGGIGDGAGSFVGGIGDIGEGAGSFVGGIGEGAGSFVGGIGDGAGSFVGGIGDIGEGAGSFVGGIGDGAGSFVGGVGDGAGSLFQGAGDTLGGLGNAMGSFADMSAFNQEEAKGTEGGTAEAPEDAGAPLEEEEEEEEEAPPTAV